MKSPKILFQRFDLIGATLMVALAAVLIGSSGCAGYHLGNQFLYNSSIRSVSVILFESDSDRRFLGQRLTEAVVKEVELSTPLTITDPQIADSFIRGRLIRDVKRVAGEHVFDEPRTIQVAWVVEVDWVDRPGVSLLQSESIRISRYDDFVPEGGQSISTAQQRIIEQVARDVVSQMQVPW